LLMTCPQTERATINPSQIFGQLKLTFNFNHRPRGEHIILAGRENHWDDLLICLEMVIMLETI
jgi:hypothetical protein